MTASRVNTASRCCLGDCRGDTVGQGSGSEGKENTKCECGLCCPPEWALLEPDLLPAAWLQPHNHHKVTCQGLGQPSSLLCFY